MPWGLECAPAARRIKAAIKEDIPTISFSVLITSLVGLFLLLGTGFFAVRARLVPMSGFDPLVSLLMKIALPATVFTSLIRPFEADFLLDGATIFVLGLVTFSLFSAVSLGLSRVLRISPQRRGTWSFSSAYGNCGFIGYPVAYALFGDEGLSLAGIMGAAFNLLSYTLGAAMVRMDAPAGERGGGGAGWREVLCTPINGSILLGLATGLNIPAQSEFLLELDIARAIGVDQAMSLLDALQRVGQVIGPVCVGAVMAIMSVDDAARWAGIILVAISLLFLLLVRPARHSGDRA